MNKLSDRIIRVLIRKDVSIHAQLFRFMSLLGTIAMAVGGVYTLAEGMEIKNVIALFALIVILRKVFILILVYLSRACSFLHYD